MIETLTKQTKFIEIQEFSQSQTLKKLELDYRNIDIMPSKAILI